MKNKIILTEIIDCHVASTPGKAAIITQTKQITYKELLEKADHLASIFQQHGLCGERIATLLPNCIEQVIGYLASFKSGNVFVPINYRNKSNEIMHVIAETDAKWLVVHEDKIGEIEKMNPLPLGIETVLVVGCHYISKYQMFEDLFEENEKLPFSPPNVYQDSPALIIYTSASTGISKGVTHSYQSLSAIIERYPSAMGFDKETIALVNMLICHVTGMQILMGVLVCGGTAILYPPFDLYVMKKALVRHPITAMAEPIPMMLDLFNDPECSLALFRNVKTILVGGNRLPKGLQEKSMDMLGRPFYTFYGITEATHLALNRGERLDKLYSIGKPRTDVVLKLIDDNGFEVAEGEVGEICFKSDRAMLGYWNNEEETKAVALTNGFIRTGDLGRIDEDGFYWFMGRKKQIIVRGASNISPVEVEQTIERHPDVISSFVVGVADPREVEVPKAYVLLKRNSRATVTEISEWVRERISDYKVPKYFEIVDQLPVGKTGKIDCAQLINHR